MIFLFITTFMIMKHRNVMKILLFVMHETASIMKKT